MVLREDFTFEFNHHTSLSTQHVTRPPFIIKREDQIYELNIRCYLIVSFGPSHLPLLGTIYTLMNTFRLVLQVTKMEGKTQGTGFRNMVPCVTPEPQLWQVGVPAEPTRNQKSKTRRVRSTDLHRAVSNSWGFNWCSCRTPQLKRISFVCPLTGAQPQSGGSMASRCRTLRKDKD